MNQAEANDNQDNQNEQLENEIDQLTQTLRDLNVQEQRIRRQSDRVQRQLRDLQREQRRRSTPTHRRAVERRDRQGDIIDFGDYVNFLTSGRFRSRGGVITQISNVRFVSARDSSGRIINREPANVEIVRKFNESHDRRRRL